ncbi:MAG TPA: hypothetical protein VGI39_12795 [Polyangiaceae bacterium]|jgi:hypothetical protein
MKLLFTRDVAALRGVSLSTARAWLVALEREHGDAVVGRVGTRLVTTEGALARALPGEDRQNALAAQRIPALEAKLERLAQRVRALGTAVAHLDVRTRGMCGTAEIDDAEELFRSAPFRSRSAGIRRDSPDGEAKG